MLSANQPGKPPRPVSHPLSIDQIPVLDSEDGDVARLVACARDGDEAAFLRLYGQFADRVYRFFLYRAGQPADAEDLTQLTFLRAIEGLPRYEERGLPFAAWLFRIARNAAIDFERTRRDHLLLDDFEHLIDPPRAGDDLGLAIERDDLLLAIGALTRDQREVLAFRFFADLSALDTGRLMGRSAATVRGLQARALAALRRQLEAGAPDASTRGREPALLRAHLRPRATRPIMAETVG